MATRKTDETAKVDAQEVTEGTPEAISLYEKQQRFLDNQNTNKED